MSFTRFPALLKYVCCLSLLLIGAFSVSAQKVAAPADFLPFLAAQSGQDTRVNQPILKVKLRELYYNDSLARVINELDQTRLLAAQGFYGAGPLLKRDFHLSAADFQQIKEAITKPAKAHWDSTDFPGFLVTRHSLSSFDYYSYSLPIYLKGKKLILVKRQYNGGSSRQTWNCWEVYKIIQAGKYQFVRSYLRKDSGFRKGAEEQEIFEE